MKDKDRPLIGINMDYRCPGRGLASYSVVASGYYDCILTSGGLPVLLPPLHRENEIQPIFDRLDGLVLVGGDDLDPKRMNLPFHPSVKVLPERRENADRLLCRLAQAKKLPILGIGLGMQEMNVSYGGLNYTHLPEDLPKCIPHYDPQGGAHRHSVEMVAKTKMYHIYGPGEIRVSSMHHQGVRKVAQGFRPSALAPDGLIEAIEHKDDSWFAVGVQWHPENDGQISLDTQLFEEFIKAAAKGHNHASKIVLAKAG
jgi:putative glutamine amidotransferase